MNKFPYFVSGSAPKLYPTETFFGNLMWSEEDGISVPYCCPFADDWGKPVSMHVYDDKEFPIPTFLDMIWLSLVENKFYSIEDELPVDKLNHYFELRDDTTKEPLYNFIVIGMAPYGHVSLWVYGDRKASLVAWLEAEATDVDMEDFCPSTRLSQNEYVEMMLKSVPEAIKNLDKNGLPPRNLFDKYMQRFTYRYLVLFEHWDKEKEQWCSDSKSSLIDSQSSQTESNEQVIKSEFDYIEEVLFDGTHDKLHDGGLMNYHEAGKPKKLAVKWHIKKSGYTAYFWFEDEAIREAFDRFYGAHPDTKTDFMIRIDSDNKKFELALYRYGRKEPQVIRESAYQLIVFKNKFEYYRSENYDQPRGAWIW